MVAFLYTPRHIVAGWPRTAMPSSAASPLCSLWKKSRVLQKIPDIHPLLASWDHKAHPSQLRLQAYRADLLAKPRPLPVDEPLYLHLDVNVQDPARLLHHYDLENYYRSLFCSSYLPASRFYLVTARKFVGGGSSITIGIAEPELYSHRCGQGARVHSRRFWSVRLGLEAAYSGPARNEL